MTSPASQPVRGSVRRPATAERSTLRYDTALTADVERVSDRGSGGAHQRRQHETRHNGMPDTLIVSKEMPVSV